VHFDKGWTQRGHAINLPDEEGDSGFTGEREGSMAQSGPSGGSGSDSGSALNDAGGARHPIGVVSERTGLSADVLRVWERRYGVVEPSRTEGGQRLYTDGDIERLRLLHLATRAGRSIGQVADLSAAALAALVREDEEERGRAPRPQATPDPGGYVDTALVAVRDLDAVALESQLRRAAAVLGVRAFLADVAAPLFRRIGDEWYAGRLRSGQEHLATVVLRRVLEGLMSAFGAGPGAARLVVATPAGEHHEIGALLVAAAALGEGWNVVYLGPDLPAAEIASVALAKGARAVALSAVLDDGVDVAGELTKLRRALPPHVPVLVGGEAALAQERELAAVGGVVVRELAGLAPVLRGLAPAEERT
jgi:MerR family transcriptional regulator, light-induced transcriptional regulator